jgi:hypothetical protein
MKMIMKLKSLWPVAPPRLVRLSSLLVEVSTRVLLLGGDQCPVEEHVNSGSRMLIQGGGQSTKQAVKPVSYLADLLPKQKGVKVIDLVNALPTDPNRLGCAVGIHALLKKLKRGKVCIMNRINARDLLQLLEKLPRLFVTNIS